jgi:hypothetical protein
MASPVVQSTDYGIRIDRPTDITRPCLQLLRGLLSDPGLVFRGEGLSKGRPGEIYLSSGSATLGFATQSYPVVRLLPKEAHTFWLALALKTVYDRHLRLTSASIILFEGLASNPTKTPLLRAEWHEWQTPGPHAQPHWHVYSSALGESLSDVPGAFFVESLVAEFGAEPRLKAPSQNIDISPFHYAMSATWHVEHGTCQERLRATSALLGWIRGCIDYTRGQLDYVTS